MKRMVVLSLVLLLSIESFAAVVSDNDGSAFITKAEFDSLKNNFQSQIDQYNTSIDSKIDGAISSYLAGIKLDKETKETMPDSILTFPLKLYATSPFNYDMHYGEGGYDYSTGRALWKPHYLFHSIYRRQRDVGTINAKDDTRVNEWSRFWNIDDVIDSGGNKYGVIDHVYDNFKAVYTMFNAFSDFLQNGDVGAQNSGCLISNVIASQQQTDGRDTYFGANYTWNLYDDGQFFAIGGLLNGSRLRSDYALTFNWNYNHTETFNLSAKNRRLWQDMSSNKSGMWRVSTGPFDLDTAWAISYDTKGMDAIFNYSGWNVPVTYDGEVKLTNYHTSYTNLFSGNVPTRRNKIEGSTTTTNGTTWVCKGFFSPPYTIADVNHCNKTDQFDTSFIKSENLLYKVKDTETGIKFNQFMINGIYLGTMEKEGKFRVELNLKYTGLYMPAVMFRKEDFWDTWDTASAKNIKLEYNNLKDQTYAELENNKTTKIEFEVDKNDKIFMKVLNPTNVDVIMEEPVLTFIG